MRRSISSSLCVLALATLFLCSGCHQNTASPTQPTNQSDESSTPYFSATIDGKEVKMSSVTYTKGSVLLITGTNGKEEIQLFLSEKLLKTGTQQYGYGHQQSGSTLGAQYQLVDAGQTVTYGVTTFLRDAGNFTITRLTDKEIEGTFECTVTDTFNGNPIAHITKGKFRVQRQQPA